MNYSELATEKADAAISDMREIVDGAVAEGRDLTPTELERMEELQPKADRYLQVARRANQADHYAKQAREFRGNPGVSITTTTSTT